uniref:Uncharacterized protein n=1 Tax=Avena sativa TaxID=4498 RepID=A0ACD5VZ48_AVESA
MSGNHIADAPATAAADPPFPHWFNGPVVLTAVLILGALMVVFALIIRVLLYLCVTWSAGRRRSSGLATGIDSFGSRRAAGFMRSISRISSSRRGLNASALSALPVTAYRKESGDAGADCAVCLSELADGDKVRELPNSGHVFHMECVDAWLRTRTTCPLCRAEAGLPDRDGKAQDAPQSRSSSAAAREPPQPSSFGAGGTLVVIVHGGSDTRRGVPPTGSGQQGSSYS